MTAPVDVEARKLADLLAVAIAGADSPPLIVSVTAVTAGGASDGNALVKVTRYGQQFTANGYLNSYTPTVGDRVIAAYVDNQLVVFGKIIGKP